MLARCCCLVLLLVGQALADETGHAVPTGQQVLFEVTHTNHAWGYRLRGRYIDGEGRIWAYDHSHEQWLPSQAGAIAEAELLKKVTRQRRLIDTIDTQTLRRMLGVVDAASRGPMGAPSSPCADAGTIEYLAYLYDHSTKQYKPVVLYQTGDLAMKNESESARLLYEWLFTVFGEIPRHCRP